MIHDISPLIHPGTAVWPGDVPFQRHVAMSIEGGDHLELSSIHTAVHIGAHTDAPIHYDGGGDLVGRPLELYYGPCQIIRVDVGRGERITPQHVPVPITAERVLFHTGTMPDPDVFNPDFASLSPELVDWLHHRGVRLVGLDTPSIDLAHDKAMISHKAVARHGMAILEGVVLGDVPDGVYTLIALPLKLAGVDASPVRAVLVEAPPELGR